VITKTVDDACRVSDPDDRNKPVEFCLIAHVHLTAATIEDAIKILANHFTAVYEGRESQPFSAGHVLIRRETEVHGNSGETTH
jgi:hypothetical protein